MSASNIPTPSLLKSHSNIGSCFDYLMDGAARHFCIPEQRLHLSPRLASRISRLHFTDKMIGRSSMTATGIGEWTWHMLRLTVISGVIG